MTKANFIFKAAWNFICEINHEKAPCAVNLLHDFEK